MKTISIWCCKFTSLAALAAAGALLVACGSGGTDGGDDDGSGGRTGAGGGSAATGGNTGSGGSGAGAELCEVEDGEPAEMVEIPAGPFTMGCDASDPECDPEEQPPHEVTLSAYSIDKTEVTQDQYFRCVADGACAPPSCPLDCSDPSLPARCVTWQDAKDYCAYAEKRLPTEAEWEKAARGSGTSKFPWGDDAPTCDLANKGGCVNGPSPVGSLPDGASEYGVLDMAGNMVEVVADYWSEDYYTSSPASDPTGPASGTQYVGRGGGWKSPDKYLRVADRDVYDPPDYGESLGFRCAR